MLEPDQIIKGFMNKFVFRLKKFILYKISCLTENLEEKTYFNIPRVRTWLLKIRWHL